MRTGAPELVRARTTLAAALASVLLVIVPLVGSSPLAASQLVALTLIVVALTSAARAAPRLAVHVPTPHSASLATTQAPPPVLRTRATDPSHHPLAPRAPGLA